MHVLGMPPAFALSQDQTLRFITRATTARATHGPHGTKHARRTAPNAHRHSKTRHQSATPHDHPIPALARTAEYPHDGPRGAADISLPFITDEIVTEPGHSGHPTSVIRGRNQPAGSAVVGERYLGVPTGAVNAL